MAGACNVACGDASGYLLLSHYKNGGLMNKAVMRTLGLVVFIAGAGRAALARDFWNFGPQQTYVQAGVQQYDWKEFSTNGGPLDKESGPMFTVGAGVSDFRRVDSGPIFRTGGRLYLGTLDYDGQTQAGIPLTTKSNYSGLQFEVLGGYRFARWLRGIDLFGGGGWEYWNRSLQNTLAADGSPAYGYREQYYILYTRFGAGYFQEFGSWSYRIKAGGKYPLYTFEHANLGDGLNLAPGRDLSGFARVSFEFGPSTQSHFGLILSYDTYRFSQSSPKLLTNGGVPVGYFVQPESHRDIYGIRGVYYFR